MQAFPLVLFPVLADAIQWLLKFGTFFKTLSLRISSLRDPTSSTCSLWCYIQLRFLALVGFSTPWIFPQYCDSIVADKVATEVNVKIGNLLFNSIRQNIRLSIFELGQSEKKDNGASWNVRINGGVGWKAVALKIGTNLTNGTKVGQSGRERFCPESCWQLQIFEKCDNKITQNVTNISQNVTNVW